MITTVTFNPAIDKTINIDNFAVNEINRIEDFLLDAGGKGINVSKIIDSLGGETIALSILGGESGKEFLSLVKKYNFKNDYIFINENTRTNLKIVDTVNNTCTDINEKGPSVTEKDLLQFKEMISTYAKKSEYLILAGNVQEGVPKTIYKDIILENKNSKVFLDTSGELLIEGVKEKPYFIKPNLEEFSELINKKINSIEDAILEAKKLVASGINYVCITLGKDGILLVSKDEVIQAIPPKVIPKSTVGAGDSVVGVMALEFQKGTDLKEALKLACSVSAATVTLMGTKVPSQSLINEIYSNVKIINLN